MSPIKAISVVGVTLGKPKLFLFPESGNVSEKFLVD